MGFFLRTRSLKRNVWQTLKQKYNNFDGCHTAAVSGRNEGMRQQGRQEASVSAALVSTATPFTPSVWGRRKPIHHPHLLRCCQMPIFALNYLTTCFTEVQKKFSENAGFCLPYIVIHIVYFFYIIVVSVSVMQLIQMVGFREEEDASTLMFPFSALWQLKLQPSIYRVMGDIKRTENMSLHSKPSCPCLTLLCETLEPKPPTNQHSSSRLV